jgi:hypothetical protein
LQRTRRVGPQYQELQLTPKAVVFRGAPIPHPGTGVIVSIVVKHPKSEGSPAHNSL